MQNGYRRAFDATVGTFALHAQAVVRNGNLSFTLSWGRHKRQRNTFLTILASSLVARGDHLQL